jgi:ABC-2 type transport system ATP-binding protein
MVVRAGTFGAVLAPGDAVKFSAVTVLAGERALLDRVTARVSARGVTVLLGPNGAGKSTLLSLVLGLRSPDSGEVALFDNTATPGTVEKGRVSAVLQDEGAFDGMTALEYATLFAVLFDNDKNNNEADSAIDRILAQSGLSARGRTRLDRLSGGELRRLQLATAVAHGPDLLVLDEPTNHLDPAARRGLLATIRALSERSSVLLATHDLHEAARIAEHVIVLVGGTVRAQGPVRALVDALPPALSARGIEGLFEHCTGHTLDASGALDGLDENAVASEGASS